MKKEEKTAAKKSQDEAVEEETATEVKAAETAEPDETEKLKQELAEKEDKFLRLCAEYDNYRKRSVKEKTDAYALSKAEVIKDLLPVIDNFERAAANSDADFDAYKKGIEMIFNQFKSILEKNSVESFGEEGEEFDPNFHSAVMTVEDDSLGENVIAQVFSKGYKLGDKVIREAVVKVANS